MKTQVSLAIAFCALVMLAKPMVSQTNYKICIKNDGRKIKGILYSVNDSVLKYLAEADYAWYRPHDSTQVSTVRYDSISSIRIWRRGRLARCLAVGAGAGFLVGGTLGLTAEEDKDDDIVGLSKKTKAVILTVGGTLAGAAAAAVVGIFRKRLVINHDHAKFKRHQQFLSSHALAGQK